MAYALSAEESAPVGIQRCAVERLERAAQALEQELTSDPEQAVHTARKSLKQTRSLLRLARAGMPRRLRRRENAALRALARSLSDARDRDVLERTFDQLVGEVPGLPEGTRVALRGLLGNDRTATEEQQRPPAEIVQALRAAQARVRQWEMQRQGFALLKPGLVREYRRGRGAMRRARSEATTEHLHDWRKRVKDLWYHLRLLGEVGGPAVSGQAQDASRLSDVLGEEHDLGLLRDVLTAAPLAPGADAGVISALDRRREQLRQEAFALGARLYAEKPAAMARRLARSWDAGRQLARS